MTQVLEEIVCVFELAFQQQSQRAARNLIEK